MKLEITSLEVMGAAMEDFGRVCKDYEEKTKETLPDSVRSVYMSGFMSGVAWMQSASTKYAEEAQKLLLAIVPTEGPSN